MAASHNKTLKRSAVSEVLSIKDLKNKLIQILLLRGFMAYGTNAPFGLRPMNSIIGGSWTEKVNEYKIYASDDGTTTYATSIFTGDPVQCGVSMGATPSVDGLVGTIVRYNPTFTDGTPSTFSTVPILGVFMGCRYQAVNSVASTPTVSSPYWPASTQVKPGTSIVAYILDDPTAIFDIQVSSHINAGANVFVGKPMFPNLNATGAASPYLYAGTFGRNFGLNIAGGTNFNTVPTPADPGDGTITYANNPAAGSALTGQSAFYLDVDTSTAVANNHDYGKNVATLPLKAIAYTLKPENVAYPTLTMATTPFLNVTVIINNHVYGKGSTPPVYVA